MWWERKPQGERQKESPSSPPQREAETLEVGQVAYGKLDAPYQDQWELMEDAFALIDYRLYLYYKYHQWLGPQGDMRNMLGLVVSREEFEHNLTKAAQTGLMEKLAPEELEQIRVGEAVLERRLALTAPDAFPLLKVFQRFGLDPFSRWVLTLCYGARLDTKYERLLAYLQDDITKKNPTVQLAVQLYLPLGESVEAYTAAFARESLFNSLFQREALLEGNLQLKPMVLAFLSAGSLESGNGLRIFDGAEETPADPLVIGRDLATALDGAMAGGPQAIAITGPEGSGRRFQIQHLMARQKAKCLFADMETLEHRPKAVEEAVLAARLLDAYVCFHGLDTTGPEGEVEPASPALTEAIAQADISREPVFLLSKRRIPRPVRPATVEFSIPAPKESERLALFTHYFAQVPMEAQVQLQELSVKFRFVPRQIKGAAMQAAGLGRIQDKPLDNRTIHACCYRQVVHRLDKLARRVEPCYTWEDVVLPQSQKRLMQQACNHIRYQHRVYQEWGFEKKLGYGKGLSILFAGAPGTGKTMCAQVIARELNMEMYKINISQIVSKYIGETEKNLQAVFNEARNSNCILFFDECDAIFGKRSDVKDAHDRNANVEVAYLLQQIEDYDGVCVLATNLVQNIDAAFMRRITYVVHFPFPEPPQRKEIYLRTLPKDAPVEDGVDWDFVAEKFELSGGHIKNIVLGAAFMAAGEDCPIHMRHVLTAAVNEMRKNEIVVVREELREYADLLEE